MNVRLQYTLRFMAGIHYEGQLQMNDYTATVYMMTNTTDHTTNNIALNRIKYFVYNELDSTIFINSDNVDVCRQLASVGLNITTLPGEPVEQIIGMMLYAKFSAITEGKLLIGEVEVSSALSDGIVYLHGDNENVDNFIEPEWWSTVDLVHCDQDLIDAEKVVTIHKNSVWRDLNLHWNDEESANIETGNTVVFADFKKLDDKE